MNNYDLVFDSAFSRKDQETLYNLLQESEAVWLRSESLGHIAFGSSFQIDNCNINNNLTLHTWRKKFSSLVWDIASKNIPNIKLDSLSVQAFPVLMKVKDLELQPGQHKHIDSHKGVHPFMTCVYYAEVVNVSGGELIAYLKDRELKIAPKSNRLVIIPGDTPHEVLPMSSGIRLSYVCNFYK